MRHRRSRCDRSTGICLSCLILLAACDGGLFGTGSGENDPIHTADAGEGGVLDGIGETATTDAGAAPTAEHGATDSTQPMPQEDAAADTDATVATQSFSNTLVGSSRRQPLVTLVNASDRTVLLQHNQGSETVAPGSDSAHVSLIPGENALRLFELVSPDGQAVEFARIAPLNVAESTLTTLIVRNAANGLDVLPLASLAAPEDPALVRVRLIIGGDIRVPALASFLLQPIVSIADSAETTFPDLSFTRPQSDYQDMPPGRYDLYDPAGGFERIPLILEAGRVYTLILGAATAQVLIEIDSAIDKVVSSSCENC